MDTNVQNMNNDISQPIQETKAIALNPQESEFNTIQRQCKLAVVSGLLPDEYKKGNGNEKLAKAVVVALKGRELGIPMMQAFSQIHVIKGKPTISAELMLALIYRAHPNARIDFIHLTDKRCEIKAARPGGTETIFIFTIEDAKKAGLLGNNTWQKYPRAMLRSRCVSEMGRTMFPDALMGCSYTPEELSDIDVTPQPKKEITPQPIIQHDEIPVVKYEEHVINTNSEPVIENNSYQNTAPNIADSTTSSYDTQIPPEFDQSHEQNFDDIVNKGGDYVFIKGKFAGQNISEVDVMELEKWVDYMDNKGFTKGEDFKKAAAYLSQ